MPMNALTPSASTHVAQGGTEDAEVRIAHQAVFADGAEHRHEDVEGEAPADLAADAQEIVDGEHHRGDGRSHRIDAQEDDGVFGQFARGAHGGHDDGGERPEHGSEGRPQEEDAEHRAGEDVVGALLLACAERDGDGNGRAHADEVAHGEDEDDERHGEVHGGEGGGAEQLPDDDAVKHVVERRREHGDSARCGRLEEEVRGCGREVELAQLVFL